MAFSMLLKFSNIAEAFFKHDNHLHTKQKQDRQPNMKYYLLYATQRLDAVLASENAGQQIPRFMNH